MCLNGQISHNNEVLLLKVILFNESRKNKSGIYMEYQRTTDLFVGPNQHKINNPRF